MHTRMFRLSAALTLSVFIAGTASAACMNRYVSRRDKQMNVVTLLTGKLTFQEAQQLAKDLQAQKRPPIEWVDEKGKTIARQFGAVNVVRPMPVGCDGKASGVVMVVNFVSGAVPSKKMFVRLSSDEIVAFEQQSD